MRGQRMTIFGNAKGMCSALLVATMSVTSATAAQAATVPQQTVDTDGQSPPTSPDSSPVSEQTPAQQPEGSDAPVQSASADATDPFDPASDPASAPASQALRCQAGGFGRIEIDC